MSRSPEVGKFNRPVTEETIARPTPPVTELLAVANTRVGSDAAADEFIQGNSIRDLLGRVLDSQRLEDFERLSAEYQTSNGDEVGVRLGYEWTYNLSSVEEDGDNEGMCFVISADHCINVDGRTLNYCYTVLIPEDSRLVAEAGHFWKLVDATGAPIDGPGFKSEQIGHSSGGNDELFIALLQRGCEDLAQALQ